MRTSLNEIEQIEAHLLQKLAPEEAFLFEARQILDPQLRERILLQQGVYALIRQYGRKKLKVELEAVHNKLFSDSRYQVFQQKIFRLFTNKKD